MMEMCLAESVSMLNNTKNGQDGSKICSVSIELETWPRIPKLKLFVLLIYSFLLLAIFFNIRVISMVTRVLICHPNSYRSDGNRHALVYILCLSIVDSLVLAHLPLVATDITLSRWIFGNIMCKLYWIIEQVNRILSTFILTALSADRYLAVCRPARWTSWRTMRAALGIIVVCLLLATTLLAPTVLYSHVVQWRVNNHTISKCMFAMDSTMLSRFLIYIFLCGYCIPLICMIYFYISIVGKLWRRQCGPVLVNIPCQDGANVAWVQSGGRRRRRTAQRVTKNALGLVSFYFACWTPYWMVQFYIHFVLGENEMREDDTIIIALYTVHVLVYVNSAVNPFLYALLNKELQRQHSLTQRNQGNRTTTCTEF